jgi:FdhD protein
VSAAGIDRAATEEPLEVRLHGRPFAVIMRTPGADRELAAGFLLSERVIAGADDLGTIEHCRVAPEVAGGADPAPRVPAGGKATREPGFENAVNVTLVDRCRERVERALADRRQVATTSSCGLCGRLTIESLTVDLPPMADGPKVDGTVVIQLPERLRARQSVFDETGGLHAAALFTSDGELTYAAEDVGRHNAVDKVIGRMLLIDQLPLAGHILSVSGRASYEIVQKAAIAGIPLVAAVSAPSTLAIELAHEAGVTLVGFLRGAHFNIYTHGHRIIA